MYKGGCSRDRSWECLRVLHIPLLGAAAVGVYTLLRLLCYTCIICSASSVPIASSPWTEQWDITSCACEHFLGMPSATLGEDARFF